MKQASKFSMCSAFTHCYGKLKKKKNSCCKSCYLVLKFLCAWGNPYLHEVFKLCDFILAFFLLSKKPPDLLISSPAGSGPGLFSFKAVCSGLDVKLQGDNIIWSVHSLHPLSQYNLRRKLHTVCKEKMSNKAELSSSFTFLFMNLLKQQLILSEWGTVLLCLFHVLSSLYDCVRCWAIVSLIEMLL